MRAVLAFVVALAGCQLAGGGGAPSDSLHDGGAGAGECATAADCVLASSTCCGCPEFAMPEAGWQTGCDAVQCPSPPTGCPAIAAACEQGVCTTTCLPVTCDLSCASGFALDAAGCLTCACATAPDAPPMCMSDSDCAEIPADCCGCAAGGSDTAVPVGEVDADLAARNCPPSPSCPGVDVCDPNAAPRCVGGTCQLVSATATNAAGECGRPDLPACPTGTVCVLNNDPTASQSGVGTCQPG